MANTLNKNITLSILGEGGYEALRARWSELCNSEEKNTLTCSHNLLYVSLMGRDWRKGFCAKDADGNYVLPITNAKKLANGGDMNWGAQHAIRGIGTKYPQSLNALLKPFNGLVTEEMACAVAGMLPKPGYYELFDFSIAYPGAPVSEVVA